MHARTLPQRATRMTALLLVAVAVGAFGCSAALGATGEGQAGAALLGQVQSGQASCARLSAGQFASIGEYVMGRMLGSAAAHNAMDAQLRATMGSGAEQQAHQFMGQRFAGCTTANGPAAFGAMMGMMGAGTMGASYGSGSGAYPGSSAGGMMGYGYQSAHQSMGTAAIVAVILAAIALLALIIFLAARRTATPKPPRPGAAVS